MAWSDLASNEVPRKDELADLINFNKLSYS